MKDKGYLGTSQHFSFPTVNSLNPTDRLVLLFFQNDKQKEWIYKGSEKLEHILNIKKRLAKDKPQKTQHKPQQPPQQTTQQHPPQEKTQQQPPQEKTQQLQQLSQHKKTQEPAITGRLLCFLHILPLLCTFPHRHVQVFIQWGKKVFSQPPIVQVLPLKKMREACNFHHRYTSTMRDKIRKTKSRKSHCRIFKEFICKLWWKISIWSITKFNLNTLCTLCWQ